MDPISIALAGGGLLGSLFSGQQAKKQAQQALAQQMRMFDEQMRFAKSGREDAYGNQVRYDEGLRRWVTDLTPYQNQLIKAGEHEQYLGLTEDAARNREARRRMASIGKSSLEDYNTQAAGFRYGGPPSEQAIFDQISQLLARSRSSDDAGYARQRIRQGQPLVTPNNMSRRNEADDALRARTAALDEWLKRQQGHNQRFLPAMGFFREGAGAGGGAPIDFGNQSKNLSGQQDAMAQLIAQVGSAGARNIGEAQQGLTKATAASIPGIADMSRLIAALRPRTTTGRSGVQPIASSTSYFKPELASYDLDKLLSSGIY